MVEPAEFHESLSGRNAFRIGEVAGAIGVPAKTLRNWLDRELIPAPDSNTDGWRTFSALEVAQLAITSKLVGFGLPIGVCAFIAGEAVKTLLQKFPRKIPQHINPLKVWRLHIVGYFLFVFPVDGEWKFILEESPDIGTTAFIRLNVSSVIDETQENLSKLAGNRDE